MTVLIFKFRAKLFKSQNYSVREFKYFFLCFSGENEVMKSLDGHKKFSHEAPFDVNSQLTFT